MPQLLTDGHGVRIRDLLPESRVFGDLPLPVASCCDDSRLCRPGDLFVALTGATWDGHEFAAEAVRNGAVAVLAERPVGLNVPVYVVDDTREAYGRVCQALANQPSLRMNVIGVTGTNGKTITSLLISSILRAAGQVTGFSTTIGTSEGSATLQPALVRHAQPEIAGLMARMTANGCDNSVLELSSQALSRRRAAGIEFDAAVITNVRRDHIDLHGSVLNYRRAKGRLLEMLKPDGFAVLNADDAASQRFLKTVRSPVITVGMRSPAEITAQVIERFPSEQTFLLTAGEESVPVRTHMIGDHHVHNCLAAAATCLVMGVDLRTIVRGLEATESVPGRLERIECGQPFGVFVDSAQSPDALAVSLRTLRQVCAGRVICVYGVDPRRDPDSRPLVGRVAERGADRSIITNNNPGHHRPLEIAHDVLDGYEKPGGAHVIPDRRQAIRWALSQAGPGDCVLIAGKGCETSQKIGHRRLEFDDREVARDCLHEAAARTDGAPPVIHSLF